MAKLQFISSSKGLVLLFLVLALSGADDVNHVYADSDAVIVWTNRIGPYHNPHETYGFSQLPLCRGKKKAEHHRVHNIGEILEGNDLYDSGIEVSFKNNVERASICSQTLSKRDAEELRFAVEQQYWYQLIVDDLPLWGMLGQLLPQADGKDIPYLFTHRQFTFTYNGNRIISVKLVYSALSPIKEGQTLDFTYSVSWKPTDVSFDDRLEKYLDNDFFEHQIHWFSIFNSFMMVAFLTGLVFLILMRTLKKDYARFSAADEEAFDALERDMGDESGWKHVRLDVFRPPRRLVLFCSAVGVGMQLVTMAFGVIADAIVSNMYIGRRATMINTAIVLYAITSAVAGYVSGGLFRQLQGKAWIKCFVVTCAILPGLAVLVLLPLNFVAMAYNSLAAVPFGTMVAMGLICLLVSAPLALAGTLLGRHWNGVAREPCPVNPIPRHIPEKNWYLEPSLIIPLGGLLPFGSIFIELYFILTSFSNYKFYYVYGFALLVLVILLIVTACVTIVSSYFLLNAEDWRWATMSFLSGASISIYVMLYSLYYFFMKTNMSGFFQTTFFFGYATLFSLLMAIMCGAIGYLCTRIFVRKIYSAIKAD